MNLKKTYRILHACEIQEVYVINDLGNALNLLNPCEQILLLIMPHVIKVMCSNLSLPRMS